MQSRKYLLTTVAALPAILVSSPLAAQSVTLDTPPVRQALDENGVDLATGGIAVPSSTLAIGSGDGLVHSRTRVGNGWRHNYILSVTKQSFTPNVFIYRVQIAGSSRVFLKGQNGIFVPESGEEGKMSETSSELIYTSSADVEYRFSKSLVSNGESYYEAVEAVGTVITLPNGLKTTLAYRSDSYQLGGITIYAIRLQSVSNNAGYQLKYAYANNNPTSSTVDDWYRISRVTAINNAEEYCSPAADSCSLAGTWPYLDYVVTTSGGDQLETVTDVLGRQSRFRNDNYERLIGVKRPSEAADGVMIAYDANSRVSSITHQDGYTRNYSWTESYPRLTAVANDALGRQRTTVATLNSGLILSSTDALGNKTELSYDNKARLSEIIAPEGNKTMFSRDDRGRVIEVRNKAKPGSGLADIVKSASYPALISASNPWAVNTKCAHAVTCDKPLSTTDARGKTTNYTYDPNHGGPTKIELPPDANGIRPRTDFTYTTQYAKVKNASGNLVQLPDGIVLSSTIKRCRTANTCAGSANEQVVQYNYNNSQAENLQPVSVTRMAGNGTLAQTSGFTYDKLGNPLTVDGPLSGSADTARNHYDVAGQMIGSVSPDPDGGGSLKHHATRQTYNADGQVTATETGTVNGQSDADWASFSPTSKVVTEYDVMGRTEKVAQVATSGSTQYSIAQYSYDAAGRPECTALRMNAPTTGTSLPSDACTPMAAGSHGSDRISRTAYDNADRVTEVRTGVGTALEQQTFKTSYNDDGTSAWVEDASGNRTRYTYDGHNRIYRITYPSKTVPHTVNASDYEQMSYDAGSNILSYRTRAGDVLGFTYDNLNRVIKKTVPQRSDLSTTHTRDVYFGYSLLNEPTYIRFDGNNGSGVTLAYDVFGRIVSTTDTTNGPARTLAYEYDKSDNRTRITHPDGLGFRYQYDKFNRLDIVRDSLSNYHIANYDYNQRGSLKKLQRLYTNVLPSYDNVGRASGITNDLYSIANDVTWGFTRNPANQIKSESQSNDTYSWDGHVNLSRNYQTNGLNQYESVGGASFCYDKNGNLTADGTSVYLYDVENRLVERRVQGANDTNCDALSYTGHMQARMHYDPLGRLYRVEGFANGQAQSHTQFLHDGDTLIAEYNKYGAMLRRYVHGANPVADDPIIWYEGSTINASSARRQLFADARGSIVAVTNYVGVVQAINTYDEYGIPDTASADDIATKGRFRYTGQAWIPELGMYYYKARIYSPTLGRFMQTDPIGYGDGMNMYRYVGNDPVNMIDPSGLAGQTKTCTGSRIKRPLSYDCNALYAGSGPLHDPHAGFDATLGFIGSRHLGFGASSGRGSGRRSTSCSGGSSNEILVCASNRSSTRWSSRDFVNHYYFGGGKTVHLADIGLAEIFEQHPSVKKQIDVLIKMLRQKKGSNGGGIYIAQTVTDVTDTIFSVGRSTFHGEIYCQENLCYYEFSIRDWFRDPVSLGFETGGIPYRILHSFGEG